MAHVALAKIRDSHLEALPADAALAVGEASGAVRHAEARVTAAVNGQKLTQTPRMDEPTRRSCFRTASRHASASRRLPVSTYASGAMTAGGVTGRLRSAMPSEIDQDGAERQHQAADRHQTVGTSVLPLIIMPSSLTARAPTCRCHRLDAISCAATSYAAGPDGGQKAGERGELRGAEVKGHVRENPLAHRIEVAPPGPARIKVRHRASNVVLQQQRNFRVVQADRIEIAADTHRKMPCGVHVWLVAHALVTA